MPFWIVGNDEALGELWVLDIVEQHIIRGKKLPFISEFSEIGDQPTEIEVSQRTNGFGRCLLKADLDKLLHDTDDNLLTRILVFRTQIDHKAMYVIKTSSLADS